MYFTLCAVKVKVSAEKLNCAFLLACKKKTWAAVGERSHIIRAVREAEKNRSLSYNVRPKIL